jgi:hypothetical protein
MALFGITMLAIAYSYSNAKNSDNISTSSIVRIEQKIYKLTYYDFFGKDAMEDIKNDYIKALKFAKIGNSKYLFYEKIADIEVYFYMSGYADGIKSKPTSL